jgi:uracil-DNA glycosylase
MPIPFDLGYGQEPFRTLVQDVPDARVFPTRDFRTEWGPVFHRGRLRTAAQDSSWWAKTPPNTR